jgi:hypothetical protein
MRGVNLLKHGGRAGRRRGRSLLVNHWYYDSVGHTIEALRVCLGYHRADRTLGISLLLRVGAATELASTCPFVERMYVTAWNVDEFEGDPPRALRDVPRVWDWIVDLRRLRDPLQHETFPDVRVFYEASTRYFRARLGHGVAGVEPPPYERHQCLQLELPPTSCAVAADELTGVGTRIALLPAGSSDGRAMFPSANSWALIVDALASAFPDATFCLIGKLTHDGRTTTTITRAEVDSIAAACPRAIDAFDRPLLDQLALVEACDVFVSPHTGFGMAALAVGTPWLTVSGGYWFEHFFNGVPFYSVIPDTDRYPCFPEWLTSPLPIVEDDDGQGPRTVSMSRARIEEDLPDLIEGARLLVDQRLSYDDALERYFERLLRALHGQHERIVSFEDVHLAYV